MTDKPWLSGEPYYCKTCGLGFAEYARCDSDDCQLESKEEAMERRRQAGAPKATEQTELMSRGEIEEAWKIYTSGAPCVIRTADVFDQAMRAADIRNEALEEAALKAEAEIPSHAACKSAQQLHGSRIAGQIRSLKGKP